MRAVVTGGAGFIGSHLIEALLDRGDSVTCLERPAASRRWIRDLPIDYRASGLDDLPALREAFAGVDVVFHLAALTEASAPQEYYRVNTEGTANVLRAAAASDRGAPRVVLLSSLAAAGPCRNGELLSPDSIPTPLSHYGHSKLLAEMLVHAYRERVPAVILRFSSVYGPRERAVLTMFRLVSRGIAVSVGSWEREVSMLYVADAVQGLIAAAETPIAVGRTYCMAHPDALSWRRVVAAIGSAVGRTPKLVRLPTVAVRAAAAAAEGWGRLRRTAAVLNRERVRELCQARWVCDVSRAARDLRFVPAYPVTRGAAETARWYRGEGWI